MNTSEGRSEITLLLSELKYLSPMPPDEEASQEILDQHKRVIFGIADIVESKSWDNLPDNIAVLLLNSIGTGEGFGLYETIASVLVDLVLYSPFSEDIHDKLKRIATDRKCRFGERALSLQALRDLARKTDLEFFTSILRNEQSSVLVKEALMGLRRIGGPSALSAVESLLSSSNERIRNEAQDAAAYIRRKC